MDRRTAVSFGLIVGALILQAVVGIVGYFLGFADAAFVGGQVAVIGACGFSLWWNPPPR